MVIFCFYSLWGWGIEHNTAVLEIFLLWWRHYATRKESASKLILKSNFQTFSNIIINFHSYDGVFSSGYHIFFMFLGKKVTKRFSSGIFYGLERPDICFFCLLILTGACFKGSRVGRK